MTARREPGQEWVCPTTPATCHSNLSDIDRDATGPIAIQHHGEKELVLDPSGHATKVAGSLAAAGIISPPSMPVFPVMKGVAYGANLRAFDLFGFDQERLDAAGGSRRTESVSVKPFMGNNRRLEFPSVIDTEQWHGG